MEKHATLENQKGRFTLNPISGAKTLRNGSELTASVELKHLDRLLFGTSQYYLFVLPNEAKPNDPYYTYEMMQDEIVKAAGLINKDTSNMSQSNFKAYYYLYH
jgi:hypothetical protein